MKKIYIVLTHSGSLLSRAIKIVKHYEYTHVSIALDKNLNQMYSFGRIKPYNAFVGGFVQESPKFGTFKRFSKTKSKIICIDVTTKQYNKIKKLMKYFNRERNHYKFNFIGLCSVAFHIKITQENGFYCAEFIKYVFDKSDVKTNLPDLVTPEDFLNLDNTTAIYKGYLKNYM
ncbi:MAG: hypothetical protein IJ509_03495 [Bacilli bacterium]|nr:hypothetical protein [Bacilli bacterium]